MTVEELRYEVFELLHEKFVGGPDATDNLFVGLQGDRIVVMQPGGDHMAILVVPATVGAPA